MSDSIDIPDKALCTAIERELGKAAGSSISATKMTTLTHLGAGDADISDLTGLEHATNLRGLYLWGNKIERLDPLEKLTKLEELGVEGSLISNIEPLRDLTQLVRLRLNDNRISNIQPLRYLINLENLGLHGNDISDLSVLEQLTRLKDLEVDIHSMADLSHWGDLAKGAWLIQQHEVHRENKRFLRIHAKKFA